MVLSEIWGLVSEQQMKRLQELLTDEEEIARALRDLGISITNPEFIAICFVTISRFKSLFYKLFRA